MHRAIFSPGVPSSLFFETLGLWGFSPSLVGKEAADLCETKTKHPDRMRTLDSSLNRGHEKKKPVVDKLSLSGLAPEFNRSKAVF